MAKKRKGLQDNMGLHGFFRIQIGEEGPDGKTVIVGDSGVVKNMSCNLGVQHMVCEMMFGIAGSSAVGAMTLGSGTAPASSATTLPNELSGGSFARVAIGGAAVVTSRSVTCSASWASGLHPGGTPAISNAALLHSSASAGSILSGNTYASSTWNSNQAVSASYTIGFGTT